MNDEQIQAITYNQGPLLVIAGPGTGKTFVIVEKIKYLIKNNLAKPEDILALTFTEKAALEMEERVDKEMPYGYFQMWISTFHSFAYRILKDEGANLGLPLDFHLMSKAEAVIFLRKNLFAFDLNYFRPLGNPEKFLEALISHFSRLKEENISEEEYLDWAKKLKPKTEEEKIEKEKYLELSKAYSLYQKLKLKEGLVDFSDLVFYLFRLFKKRPNLKNHYQRQFRYVLVDEFQDTNIVQYDLLKLLFPKERNPFLTVVGDDSQAIYKFRGASVSNILNFMKDYPEAKRVTLVKNYRSCQTILDAAYRLIKHNDPDTLEAKLGISKNLISQKKDKKGVIDFYLANNVEEEAEFVAKKIIALKEKHKYLFSDFAVLVRANSHTEPFIRAFSRFGIPYQFLGPSFLFHQPEVKDLIAYLYFLSDIEDSSSFYRVLTMEIFDIDKRDLASLLSFSRRISQPLFLAFRIYLSLISDEGYEKEFEVYKKYLPLFTKKTKETFLKIYKMIDRHLKLLRKETAGQILYYFLEDTGYLSKLVDFKTEKEEKKALNISKFFNKLKTFEMEHEDASVFAVSDWIKMSLELNESPQVDYFDKERFDAVNILTIHSAKGLEFPVVFLVNLTQGRFPTYERQEKIALPDALIKEILPFGDYHLEEERRLFYVGLTRAADYVFLTASLYYGEGKKERKISQFLVESLGKEFLEKKILKKKDEKKQLSIFDFAPKKETVLTSKVYPLEFSFSALEVYKTCPLQYKYQYVLKIPTIPTAAESFGVSVHQTLQRFYQRYQNEKTIDFNTMLEIYRQSFIPIGYSSPSHFKRMKKEGEKILKDFFERFHPPEGKILALEKNFKIKLEKEIVILGKIDRLDEKEDGKIEIIDYKTGKMPEEKELKKSLQLSIYALAATDKGTFNKKLSDIILTFYFLNEGKKISFQKEKEDIKKLKEVIEDLVSQIRQEKFEPNVGLWCDFCPFRIICEAWR